MENITGSRRSEIFGNRHFLHEGCDGITLCEAEEICFRSGRMVVHIKGHELRVTAYTKGVIAVEGVILSVEFGY